MANPYQPRPRPRLRAVAILVLIVEEPPPPSSYRPIRNVVELPRRARQTEPPRAA